MCNFLSGVSLKPTDGRTLGDLICDPEHTDEHHILIASRNVRDDEQAYLQANLARWEFTPPENKADLLDLKKWMFTVDERESPPWFDLAAERERAEGIVARMIVRDRRAALLGGCWIFSGKDAGTQFTRGRIIASVDGANLDCATLSRATLYGATLDCANLSHANLSHANLSHANLSRATLYGATLDCATLDCATLDCATLSHANLSGANLSRANLSHATLYGATLDCANLDCATLYGAKIHKGATLPDGWIRTDAGIIVKK
jgi:hypothetical protein